jgi:hypothetical protein
MYVCMWMTNAFFAKSVLTVTYIEVLMGPVTYVFWKLRIEQMSMTPLVLVIVEIAKISK